jgi:hypothetical protein
MTYRLAFIVNSSDNTLEVLPGTRFLYDSIEEATEYKQDALGWLEKTYGANLSLSDIYIVPSDEFEFDFEFDVRTSRG